ncbi:dimethylarginine dimethylaminohydrolase family protein [Caldibacillus lycopersici]|uniref:Dimethylarginine dimethylaminohydrolase family protein n=1 Tax=Perspicuibacillus lycopersici TaxID=1325689 RepID=A0AAE3IUE9_9BACI|nr:dimethylarginine dimethylaminohydrolase family protein [Perspicuibacillus lycopersici]MCU9614825.1 dimethylarginine dimethylaminohydrolase family protein [Perspicuibacillus lycopersici]
MEQQSYHISCYSEYDVLKKVIVCQPQYMTIRSMINETQKHYQAEGIHIEKALKQHDAFVQTLRNHNIEVILLPYHKKYPEQVFTRDIGFTLGETVFVAQMANKVRIGEENVLKQWLEDEEISYYNIIGHQIEGGDVIIDGDHIFIGLSNRTNQEAIEHLSKLLDKQFTIIPIDFHEKFLHLDCVFNIISSEFALYYPEALDNSDIKELQARYELIPVSKEEQFTLGTNVLSIGNKKVISLPVNKKVNQQLRDRGFEVIEVDITEIIKSGGSFRCCTLPIERKAGANFSSE